MHQVKKGNQWHFGIKAHVGVDADSGLVHTVVGTAANVNDVTKASALVHGEETDVFADAGYQGVARREKTQRIKANWHVAMRPGKRKALHKSTPMGVIMDKLEHVKARSRAKVEHPFRVIRRQFGFVKVRYRRDECACSTPMGLDGASKDQQIEIDQNGRGSFKSRDSCVHWASLRRF
jgi:IS5 family transposase